MTDRRFIPFLPLLLLLLAIFTLSEAAKLPKNKAADPFPSEKKTTETFKPCQTRSPNSGSFFDLNQIRLLPPPPQSSSSSASSSTPSSSANRLISGRNTVESDENQYLNAWRPRAVGAKPPNKSLHRDVESVGMLQEKDAEKEPPQSWHARGQDYPSNFSMNFCGPVVEDIKDVVGVHERLWANVSAFYTMNDHVFSIGNVNTDLTWRGRKLTLNFTGGSFCPKAGREREDQTLPVNLSQRRKSTLISLLCERDPLAPKVSISFVGTNDDCTYFFEARSSAACPSIQIEKQQVGPSGVFSIIAMIAFLVYLAGGIVYQRAVMHQRGWRQLPNYALWHGIFSFLQDFVLIGLATCSSCLGSITGQGKRNRGFNQLSNGDGFQDNVNARRGRTGRQNESDENRLIDELDEEWHD